MGKLTSDEATREKHKELWSKLEEMFWGKGTKLVIIMGIDPDDHSMAVTGPGVSMDDIIKVMKDVSQAASKGSKLMTDENGS